jgi:hypothetical protein
MSRDRSLGRVRLSCPPLDTTGLAEEIRRRGNIPLRVADRLLLELPMRDIRQSWASTEKLPAQKVAALSWQLAHTIAEDDAPENHGNEAAALFLLALRHQHASLDRALNGCEIIWNENVLTQKVEYLS